MIGFSDFLVILGVFLVLKLRNARTINTISNIIIVYSTLCINIIKGIKKPTD